MRILAVSHSTDYTGAALMLYRLLLTLRDRHHIDVLTVVAAGPLAEDYRAAGIAVPQRVNTLHYDLVLCNTILTGDMLLKAAEDTRTLWWIHEPRFGLDFIEQGRVETGAFTAADTIVFPNAWQRDSLYAPWLETVDPERVHVVPPGVAFADADAPLPDPVPVRETRPFRLLQVGTVERRKGPDLTIQALRKTGLKDAEVWFLGRMGCRFQGLDPAEPFHFPGAVSEAMVQAHLRNADAFILPTRDDLVPLALIEAMGQGLCSLASAIPSIATDLRNDEHLLLSPPEDIPALARNILRLKQDPALRARLGTAGAARVRDLYNLERYRSRMTALIEGTAI